MHILWKVVDGTSVFYSADLFFNGSVGRRKLLEVLFKIGNVGEMANMDKDG